MSNILRLDMAVRSFRWEETPAAYAALGGRGLTSRLIREEVPPTCNPLGPANKLVVAPGLLSGAPAANTGSRISRRCGTRSSSSRLCRRICPWVGRC